jgi:hypothetical protein
VPLKRLVSIFLILVLSFAGASSILHQLEQEETHSHAGGTHLCASDSHHHCSLCDTLITFGFISSEIVNDQEIVWSSDYIAKQTSPLHSKSTFEKAGRAPPMK